MFVYFEIVNGLATYWESERAKPDKLNLLDSQRWEVFENFCLHGWGYWTWPWTGCMCVCVYVWLLDAWSAIAISSKPHKTLPAKVLQNKLLNWNWLEANWWRGVKRSWASEFVALIDVNCAQTPINAHACASKTIAGFSCLKCRCNTHENWYSCWNCDSL